MTSAKRTFQPPASRSTPQRLPLADRRLESVESDYGAFRSLSATFCLAMTLAVATAALTGLPSPATSANLVR